MQNQVEESKFKYVLNWQDLQIGDIVIDREESDESRKIRRATKSDYSHAGIYVDGTIMEANGIAVQSVNPQRRLYDSPDDVVVLRCESAEDNQLIKACLFARSEFGKEYSISKLSNTQYCFRLVAEAYDYAGIEIVKTPTRCNANDFINSELLHVIPDMTRVATKRDLEIANSDGVMKDKGHYNQQSEEAADMFSLVRQYISEQGGEDVDVIQDDGKMFEYLISHPEFDDGVSCVIKDHPYFTLWQEHEKIYPWEFDSVLLRAKAGVYAMEAAKQILDSCYNMTSIGWEVMYDIVTNIYETHHLKTADVYVNLYRNLLQMKSRREKTAREILES